MRDKKIVLAEDMLAEIFSKVDYPLSLVSTQVVKGSGYAGLIDTFTFFAHEIAGEEKSLSIEVRTYEDSSIECELLADGDTIAENSIAKKLNEYLAGEVERLLDVLIGSQFKFVKL